MKRLILLLILLTTTLLGQTTTQKGVDLIKYFEGFRSKAYLCPASVWTIGYGSTEGVRKGMVITREEGELLLRKDMIRFEKYVQRTPRRVLKWHQFDALVAFSFNLGYRLKGNLLEGVNSGNNKQVVYEMSKFNRARINGTLQILPGLVKRRKAEGILYKDGVLKLK